MISQDYGLCTKAPVASNYSYNVHEDYEKVVMHIDGAEIIIGVSLFPTGPAYAIAARHPLLIARSPIQKVKAVPIFDLFYESNVQKVGVINSLNQDRPVLYIEIFGQKADRQRMDKLMEGIYRCQVPSKLQDRKPI